MPRRHLRLLVLLTALLTAPLAACDGHPGPQDAAPTLPDGAGLLVDSSQAMRQVTTTKIAIDVQGNPPGFQIKQAEAQLTREGSAKGRATIEMGGIVEVEFVILGDKFYLRGPTGGFRELSTSSAFLVYDPTVILNPDLGVSAVLASGTAARTEAREQLDGLDCYRVHTTFPRKTLGKFVPGFNQDSTGDVWIAAGNFQLLQAQFPTHDGGITFRFSDFNAPADITAPI
jgi:lipoprotein LprG